jgi:crotonobetainyl-CoA:carnitine CoA-transferase CaiB-like acyl-CoA transferase
MTGAAGHRAPLAGVRVVSIEQAVAAPLCSRHLSDLGADVIKVERVDRGDFARYYDSAVHGQSTYFVWLNRGKRSIALDLKRAEGVEILHRLLAAADVLLSNLAPGALPRIVDDDTLTRRYPQLIRCAISGYGDAGPYRDRKAYDLLVQGEAGITLSTGTSDAPAKTGVSVADLAGGSYAVSAVLAALLERASTGRGRGISVSLFDVMAEWMMPLLLMQQQTGRVPAPAGTHHASITPYGAYCLAGGEMINIAVQNNEEWRRLCSSVLGAPELGDDPRFGSNALRLARRAEVEDLVSRALARNTFGEVAAALDAAGLPWGRLNDVAGALAHPQLADPDRWVSVRLPGGDKTRVLDDPFLSGRRFPRDGILAVPGLGGHTREILRELGYPDDGVDRLVREGVVAVGDSRVAR